MDLVTGMAVMTKSVSYMGGVALKVHLLWKIVLLLLGVFWIIMLINCLQRNFKIPTDKVAWTLVLVFLPILGAFIYLFSLYFQPGKKKK